MAAFTSPTLALPPARLEAVAGSDVRPVGDGVLLGEDAAHWLTRHSLEQGDYWRGFLTNDPVALVTNMSARTGLVVTGDAAFPLGVTGEPGGNAYPCSLLAQYVSYPLAELGLVSSWWQRWGAFAGLNALQLALLAGEVDRTVQWNSWLLSTNLIPDSLPCSVTRDRKSVV